MMQRFQGFTALVAVGLTAALATSAIGAAPKISGGHVAAQTKGGRTSGVAPEFMREDWRGIYQQGMVAFDRADFKVAAAQFEQVLQIRSDDPEALLMYGMSLAALDQLKDARIPLERLVQIDRNDIIAHRQLAIVLARLGDDKARDKQLAWLQTRLDGCNGRCKDAVLIKGSITVAQATVPEKVKVSDPH